MGQWETPGQSDEWFTPPHVFEALGWSVRDGKWIGPESKKPAVR